MRGGVVEWWSGGVVEWWSGGVVEWRGGLEVDRQPSADQVAACHVLKSSPHSSSTLLSGSLDRGGVMLWATKKAPGVPVPFAGVLWGAVSFPQR